MSKYNKPLTQAQKDKYNKQRRDKVRKDPRTALLHRAKMRAKKFSLNFSITIEDIMVTDNCPILGIPMKIGDVFNTDNSPSLDRIKPDLGYVKGNVVVMSYRANRFKSDSTLEELKLLIAWMKQQENKDDNTNTKTNQTSCSGDKCEDSQERQS